MQYRKGAGDDMLSALGYGCMRFTRKAGSIDLEKTEREIMCAIEGGVNYLDTAYIYPGSEATLGKILEKNHCRDKVYIATKLPQYLIKTSAGIEKTFKEELSRLRTDHVDYYLMHMITDYAQWEKLERLGIREWVSEKKHSGEIRHIGFSFHGNSDTFIKVLDAYDWDFCQIQYNYMDENAQAGRRGLEASRRKGVPVIIMEPLRGGRLVNLLPKGARDVIASSERNWSAAEWALRWLWNQEGVSCVLSGMNSEEMVRENIAAASSAEIGHFSRQDFEVIDALRSEINANIRVGCTGCGYCMPCPQGVDIPGCFRCLNEIPIEGRTRAKAEYWQVMSVRKTPGNASRCIGCGKCEKHCPQHLEIRKRLKETASELETPIFHIASWVLRRWKPW